MERASSWLERPRPRIFIFGPAQGLSYWIQLLEVLPYFILDELVSLVKVFRLAWIVLVFRVWTQFVDVQHLIYWQGQRVCDALFFYDT